MLNPRTIAKSMAYADIATQATKVKNDQAEVDAETAGLQTLESSLTAFKSAADALNSEENGPLAYSITASDDTVTATTNSEAQPGSYSFYVSQLAQAQQTTFSMSDDAIAAQGTMTLTMGDSTMDIDLSAADASGDGDGYLDADELVTAINDSDENPGVTATLVKTDGQTTLMLTSDDTGAAGAFSMSASGNSDLSSALGASTNLSEAQDAIIHLGSDESGPTITNSSNTFTDIVPGVTMTFTEVSDGEPVTLKVSQDTTTTAENVQTFVDAYNTLVDTLDALTDVGSNGESGGVFAGDAGLNALSNQLDTIIHADYNGYSLVDYGITLDSDGHLQVDSTTFNEAVAENPQGLSDIFVGPDSMVAQIDTLMDTYLNSSTGIITSRQQTLDDKQQDIDDKTEQLTNTYNQNYERYLKEYTDTMVEIATMKKSMAFL